MSHDRKPQKKQRSTRVTTSGYASGATATAAVHPLPAGVIPTRTIIECESPMTFSAGTTTGATGLLGRSGDTDFYATSFNLGAMVAGDRLVLTAGVAVNAIDATARDVIMTITPTGGTPDSDEISGGVFHVHQEYDVAPTALN